MSLAQQTSLLELVEVGRRELHSFAVILSKLVKVFGAHLGVARRRRPAPTDVFHVDVDGQVVDVDRLLVGQDGHLRG